MSEIKNANDFLLGQLDCRNGEPVKQGMSNDYYRGFETEYTAIENRTYLSTRQNEAIYGTDC